MGLAMADELSDVHAWASPSLAAMRAEMQLRFQEALNDMDPLDREVQRLRHFEE
jgi:hypothetical protein